MTLCLSVGLTRDTSRPQITARLKPPSLLAHEQINSLAAQSELVQHAAVISDRLRKLGQKQNLAAGRGDVSSFSFPSSVRLSREKKHRRLVDKNSFQAENTPRLVEEELRGRAGHQLFQDEVRNSADAVIVTWMMKLASYSICSWTLRLSATESQQRLLQ